jgi:hypothetical protein
LNDKIVALKLENIFILEDIYVSLPEPDQIQPNNLGFNLKIQKDESKSKIPMSLLETEMEK